MSFTPTETHRTRAMRLVFVPGLCCRASIWDDARALMPDADAVAIDWPWPERIRSYDDGASWLADAIATHAPDVVVAHSFGGVIALHLRASLAAAPRWRLVVVDTFLVDPHPVFRNHVWGDAAALRTGIAAMLDAERPRFPLLRELAMADAPAGWRERALGAGASFIYGGRSDEHDAATLGALAGVPANAGHDVRVVGGASHFPMLERAEAFVEVLRLALGSAAPRR